MKSNYLDHLTELLQQARPRLAATHRLEFKNIFGAVAGYVDGNIFVSCGKFGVALRLPPDTLKSVFIEEGVKPLKYFPKGHIKKEYAVLPKQILNDKDQFKRLLDQSIRYAKAS